ncbi:MAG: response regulator [Candidatus Thermoplasmatota archaeon]|nr:response regulator [Candidatus Thermoplasmatota archaeon]
MKYRVLIAEEDITGRAILREAIKASGISTNEIREVTDIPEMEKYCEEYRPKVCILSVSFPGWEKEVIRRIKLVSPETKVILATNQITSVLKIMGGIGAGAERNYLTKPYRRDEIEEILKKSLA